MIESLNIDKKIFNKIRIASDYPPIKNSYRKPSTRFGLELIKTFKIKLNELIYIGDSISDLETAKNLKCMAYGFDHKDYNNLKSKVSKRLDLNFQIFNTLNKIKNEIIIQDN